MTLPSLQPVVARKRISSPPPGAERLGEVEDSEDIEHAHLTLPALHAGPLPLPLMGGEEEF
jgi:hypothetical protein